jgi:hypothetical protein
VRGKKSKRTRPLVLTDKQLAERFAKQNREAKENRKWQKLQKVINKFRPRKSERGSIVFLGANGARTAATRNRKGVAIYVSKTGKKTPVRQYDRKSKKLERHPHLRKIHSVDVSRVRSKRAKKVFFQAYTNRIAAGAISEIPASGKTTATGRQRKISCAGTRFCGAFFSKRIDRASDAAKKIGTELARAANTIRSKRDFVVTVGISVQVIATGENYFVVTQRRFSRRDTQATTKAEAVDFIGREIYGFLARDLQSRGLVMQGSATHIKNLPENKGKKREDWKKEGFLWEGHDSLDVKIQQVEWRIDQQTFGH